MVNISDHPVKLSSGLEVGIIQSTYSVTKIPPLKLEQICHAVQPIEQADMSPSHSVHLPFDLNLDDTDLNPAQVVMVKCLLGEFKDIFSLGSFDIGCTPLLQHTTDTTQDKPILVRPRRLPIHVQAEVQVIIDDMLKFGIIQPSQSPWCAPVVVVAKKDGSKRLCVDFRKLNRATIRDSYPLPRIEDVLNVLAGCRYFSALDMKAGYHHVEVAPADRAKTGKHQFVVPYNKREEALKTFHDLPTSGHQGITQTYEKICDQLWWPKLKKDVHYWCDSCKSCARFKTHHLPKAPLQSLVAGHPNEVVAIDFVGPMPGPTKLNNVYLLVMVDHFTRYAEAVALPDRQASSVAKALMRKWITRHGLMEVLHSDQAQEFESDLLAKLCTLLHIKKSRYSSFHPEGNSIYERLNGTLLSILKPCMSAHPDDWDILVSHILMAYRSTRHSSTGFTPNYLMTGREMRLPAHVIFPSPEVEPQLVTEYARQLRHNLQTAFRDTSLHLSKSHEHTKDRSQVTTLWSLQALWDWGFSIRTDT